MKPDANPGVVVVTGASAGVGRAAACAFAARGWRVGLLARDADRLAAARRDVEARGGQALVLVADIADPQAVEAAAERVEREWGAIDVWVNNAMATLFCDVARVSPEDFRRATDVTYLGAVWGTRSALARMRKRDRGVIVQVGSALAFRSIPLQSAYCGAKAALRGFTDSLRCELIHEHSKIHLTMVHLAAFNTPQFDWARNAMGRRAQPVGRIFQPEIAADAIVWAATHRRREVWVGFPAVMAIIGERVLPGYLDRKMARDAWEGQFTKEPLPPDRPDNLYETVPGDWGAHGRFDARAHRWSPHWRLSRNRWVLGAGLAVLVVGGVLWGWG